MQKITTSSFYPNNQSVLTGQVRSPDHFRKSNVVYGSYLEKAQNPVNVMDSKDGFEFSMNPNQGGRPKEEKYAAGPIAYNPK